MHPTDQATDSEVRFWHRGKTPPNRLEFQPVMDTPLAASVYDGEKRTGDYASLVSGLSEALAALQRQQLEMCANHADARLQQFLFSLLSLTDDAQERVSILKQLGTFIFRRTVTAPERQQLLRRAVVDLGDGDLSAQASELMAIWRPEPKSFIDALLQRPGEAGRALTRRLNADGEAALSIVCHNLDLLTRQERETFINSGVIAYLQNNDIHLLGEIGDYLRLIDGGQASHGLNALHLLLMHELVEALLRDTTNLDAAAAHIVATTFERCLGDNALPMAVESYLVDWESNHARAPAPAEEEEEDMNPIEAWQDCMVYHDELRPEAFVQHSMSEQRKILREMFGEDWTAEDDAELVPVSVAAA
ncbi:MAG: hypothetical protein HN712_23635 [Gemmatimonadetes bacterium]|jgi:hypothetical protein|nr:hypothetical protein [Gemmatimonadota bacterium]MBT7863329.1 hypothetical protein [Gemmatimonadota bacterium]